MEIILLQIAIFARKVRLATRNTQQTAGQQWQSALLITIAEFKSRGAGLLNQSFLKKIKKTMSVILQALIQKKKRNAKEIRIAAT